LDLGLYTCPLVDTPSMRKAGLCRSQQDDDPWGNARPPPPRPQQGSNNLGGLQPQQQPRSGQGWANSNNSSGSSSNVGDNGGGAGGGLQPSAQVQRLRQLMQSLGIAGLPGLGMDVASRVASGGMNGQQGGNGAMRSNPMPGSRRGRGQQPGGPPRPPPRSTTLDVNGIPLNSPDAVPWTTATDAINDWGAGWGDDWDPEEELDEEMMEQLAEEAEAQFRKRNANRDGFRDKWITPLLDFQAVAGAVDPDQERTEDLLQGEALANKDESQTAIRYAVQLVVLPLVTGFVVSRALADPVLSFTLQNNAEAFAMTDRQKVEGAQKVHIEEARLRFDMAIGKMAPVTEDEILLHLREFAGEVEEEERKANEQNLLTVVSDSTSSTMLFGLLSQQTRSRQAFFNTLSRLFDGLSDIAKAVMIILIADTLLGYHSEEGWTGLIELVLGHYGFEADEEGVVIFVGVVPVVIDVFFKYWIFVGLNKISPGAVVTIKQIDTH